MSESNFELPLELRASEEDADRLSELIRDLGAIKLDDFNAFPERVPPVAAQPTGLVPAGPISTLDAVWSRELSVRSLGCYGSGAAMP